MKDWFVWPLLVALIVAVSIPGILFMESETPSSTREIPVASTEFANPNGITVGNNTWLPLSSRISEMRVVDAEMVLFVLNDFEEHHIGLEILNWDLHYVDEGNTKNPAFLQYIWIHHRPRPK